MTTGVTTTWELIRRDAARWVRPQQFSDPQLIGPATVVRLLLGHPSFRATSWMRIGNPRPRPASAAFRVGSNDAYFVSTAWNCRSAPKWAAVCTSHTLSVACSLLIRSAATSP